LGSKVNILFFICAPLAFVAEGNHWGEGPTFVLAMLAIAPLAERLGYLTEQLAFHTNDTLGGMLNATFGNSVETLISIVALMKAKDARAAGEFKEANFFLTLIQTSLLGSMLSNLLLVQGSAFFVGGLRHPMQTFSRDGAVTSAGLLVMATLALSVPTMLWSHEDQVTPTDQQMGLSRFVSICLLVIYLCFLLFQLRTHRFLFERASEIHKAGVEFDVVATPHPMNITPLPMNSSRIDPGAPEDESFEEIELTQTAVTNGNGVAKRKPRVEDNGGDVHDIENGTMDAKTESLAEDVTGSPMPILVPAAHGRPSHAKPSAEVLRSLPSNATVEPGITVAPPTPSRAHEAEIGLFFAVFYLCLSTVAVAFVSHVVVEAAEGAVDSLHLNPAFIGGVVVPIVGNAAEHASALMFAWRDKMDTALAIAVGSAIQIPLFVLPVCVLVGWAAEVPLTLYLDQFMMTIVVVTSLALAFTLHAGSSHWLHGLILIFEYLIIGAAFWFK